MNILAVFKALSDQTRLRLVKLLLLHELNVNEIVEIMEMGQSRISRHLKILSDAGLLKSRRNGLWIFYSVPELGQQKEFIDYISPMLDQETYNNDLRAADRIISERKKESVRFFDSIARHWHDKCLDMLGDFDLRKRILKTLGKVETAADLGCGSGYLLPSLSKKSRQVIGIDRSMKMLDEARKNLSGLNPDLRIGEIEHLPMRDREADLAVINLVLHHLRSPGKGIRESFRVLRSGGRFIITELLPHSDEKMRNEFGDYWLGIPENEIRNWMNEAGFVIENVEQHALKNGHKIAIYRAIKK